MRSQGVTGAWRCEGLGRRVENTPSRFFRYTSGAGCRRTKGLHFDRAAKEWSAQQASALHGPKPVLRRNPNVACGTGTQECSIGTDVAGSISAVALPTRARAALSGRIDYIPPSTHKLTPVMYPARGLTRNATALAISSSRPTRPSGTE